MNTVSVENAEKMITNTVLLRSLQIVQTLFPCEDYIPPTRLLQVAQFHMKKWVPESLAANKWPLNFFRIFLPCHKQ